MPPGRSSPTPSTTLTLLPLLPSLPSPPSSSASPSCYFSYVPPPSSYWSADAPSPPVSAYSPDIAADPCNPLLAFRQRPLEYEAPSIMDASRLLQLQTAAAHSRPAQQPREHSASTSSSNSSSGSSSRSPSEGANPTLHTYCCSRCRRVSGANGVVMFGTNLYYCSHCASMTGYAG